MKRFLFSVCALAAVVVGCSKSEVLNRPNAEKPIEFNPYTGRIPVTKATVADETVLGGDGFQVYAYLHDEDGNVNYNSVYMDKIVTWDPEEGDNGAWTYPGNAYWPATRELTFVAYGRNALPRITKVEDAVNPTISFNVPEVVAEQMDLIVPYYVSGAKYDESNENSGTVKFLFNHLLSRIQFSLVTKKNNNTLVTIEQLNLVGKFHSNGTVRLDDGDNQRAVITPTANAEDITYKLLGEDGTFTSKGSETGLPIFNNGILYEKYWGEGQSADNNDPDDDAYVAKENVTQDMNNAVDANEKNRFMMIIPTSTGHNAKLWVKYFLPGAGTFAEVPVDLSNVAFEAGKSYNFRLKVSTNDITFDVDVEDWDITGEDSKIENLN